jgi:hypothetical protein
MNTPLLRILTAALGIGLIGGYAFGQTPIDPATASKTNPNPATSTTTDEEGNNPLAREGDHSPTGNERQLLPEVGQPHGTVGSSSPEGGGTGVADPLYSPLKR